MKKRYIAVVLFLLVGLPTFVFANPSDDAEQESISKTVSNNRLTDLKLFGTFFENLFWATKNRGSLNLLCVICRGTYVLSL